MKIQYVLLTVLSPDRTFVVGLTKKRGPAFLLEKLTFPGGKMEAGESLTQAASREMFEETGLHVLPEQWRHFATESYEDYDLHKLVAVSPFVLQARQKEAEPVWHLAVSRHLNYCFESPDHYAPDFGLTLTQAIQCLDTPCENDGLIKAEPAELAN